MRKYWGCSVSAGVVLYASMAGAGWAQDAAPAAKPDEGIEDVTVVGIRRSLEQSADIKKKSAQFVDSIVAEDIGKLPDQNVAESLARVSGVQVRRGIDEANDISIRGLRQNRLEFNGRTLISPYGRGADGPDDGAYNVLTLIPSELVARMDVTKLPSAAMTEGSLGGTVNIMTRQPTKTKKPFLGMSAEAIYKEDAGKMSQKVSALASKSFFDRKLGVAIGLAYQELKISEDSFDSNTGFQPLTSAFNSNPQGIKFDPNSDGTPGFFIADLRYQRLRETRTKIGVTGKIEWLPNPDFSMTADILYAEAGTDRERNWVAVPLSGTGSQYTNVVMSPNETLIAGTIRAVVQGNSEYFDLPTKIYTGSWGAKWHPNDRLTLSGELSYTKGEQDYIQTFLRNQLSTSTQVTFDFRDTDVPSISFPSTVSLTDPTKQVFTTSFDNLFHYDSDEVVGSFDLKYDFTYGIFRSFEVGARYNTITMTRTNYRATTTLGNKRADLYPNKWKIVEFDDLLDGASGTFPKSFIAPLPFGDGAQFACETFVPTCTPQTYDPLSSYSIEEPVKAWYGQLNLEGSLFGLPYTGNAGVRQVATEVIARGTQLNAANLPAPVEIRETYSDTLPSAALRFELSEELLFRLGAAKVIARPDTRYLSPALTINRTLMTATGGNPRLQPFRISQIDASLEWYRRRGAVISLAAFYKDVSTFIITRQQLEQIPGETGDFRITRQINGTGGKIQGFELLVQQPLDFLPAPFDGFGVNVTYSYIDSSTPFVNQRTGEDLPLESLSKQNINVVAYYEKGPFGIRLAYNWRDKYLDKIGTGGDGVFYDGGSSLSASTKWDVNRNLQFYLQGANLGDEPNRKYGGLPEATARYGLSGRTFTLGFRLKN